MTTKTTTDGVPRYIGEARIVGLYYPARCTKCGWLGSSEDLTDEAECTRHEGDRLCLGYTEEVDSVYLLGVVQAIVRPDSHPKPDPVLCRFYDVTDWAGLVRELVDHVAQLQDSAKRNVKPWEDTFPPTLLPAYIERVNTENAAAQHQENPVAVVPELTSELRWILGQMCFQHIHTAQALRLMGHQIARKAEDEQAVTIYWMLGHYLKDPANWRQNAMAELKAAAPPS